MKVSHSIFILKPRAEVWSVITDIESLPKMLSSVVKTDILEKPNSGLIGLKWQESRKMFGMNATKVMWIAKATDNKFFLTHAQSHGSFYTSRWALEDFSGGTIVSVSFSSEPTSLVAKCMSLLTRTFMASSVKKAFDKDLSDIKRYLEQDQ